MNLDWRLYHVVLLQMSTEQLLSSLILHAYFIAFGYSHLIPRPSFYSTASFVLYVFCHLCPCWPCCCRIMTICLCFCSLNQAKPKLHLRISKQLFMCGVVSWTFSQYSNPVGIFSSSFFCLYVVGGNIWTYLDSNMNRSLVWLADHLFGRYDHISNKCPKKIQWSDVISFPKKASLVVILDNIVRVAVHLMACVLSSFDSFEFDTVCCQLSSNKSVHKQ